MGDSKLPDDIHTIIADLIEEDVPLEIAEINKKHALTMWVEKPSWLSWTRTNRSRFARLMHTRHGLPIGGSKWPTQPALQGQFRLDTRG